MSIICSCYYKVFTKVKHTGLTDTEQWLNENLSKYDYQSWYHGLPSLLLLTEKIGFYNSRDLKLFRTTVGRKFWTDWRNFPEKIPEHLSYHLVVKDRVEIFEALEGEWMVLIGMQGDLCIACDQAAAVTLKLALWDEVQALDPKNKFLFSPYMDHLRIRR